MTSQDDLSQRGAQLRRRAEAKFRAAENRPPARLSPEETQQLLHELQVHQIELELHNKELLRTQEELETSRSRYFDLHDLAPVAHIMLSEQAWRGGDRDRTLVGS